MAAGGIDAPGYSNCGDRRNSVGGKRNLYADERGNCSCRMKDDRLVKIIMFRRMDGKSARERFSREWMTSQTDVVLVELAQTPLIGGKLCFVRWTLKAIAHGL